MDERVPTASGILVERDRRFRKRSFSQVFLNERSRMKGLRRVWILTRTRESRNDGRRMGLGQKRDLRISNFKQKGSENYFMIHSQNI